MTATRTRTKFELKREASRAALIASAMRSFSERGYAATTVADIVAPTAHTSGAFYFHFKDKAECFWAVLDHRETSRGEWWVDIFAGLDPGTTDLEGVLARTFAHFDASHDGVGGWALVMVEFHKQHRDDTEAAKRLTAAQTRWHAGLSKFVAALGDGGWIEPGRDPDSLATQTFAFVEGMNLNQQLYGLDPQRTHAELMAGLVELLR